MRVTYDDCLLNANLQLSSDLGVTTTDVLLARAAMAQAWLRLAEELHPDGWVDLEKKLVGRRS